MKKLSPDGSIRGPCQLAQPARPAAHASRATKETRLIIHASTAGSIHLFGVASGEAASAAGIVAAKKTARPSTVLGARSRPAC
jgi:hypothetical protein